MINNSEFSKRLKIILNYYELSAAAFAEKINVQRSSISHLLSGRNKPSLDFVLKVLSEFKEVELYWFLNGKGHFPKLKEEIKENVKNVAPTLFSQDINESLPTKIENEPKKLTVESPTAINSEIERIVIFYKNGRFKEYRN